MFDIFENYLNVTEYLQWETRKFVLASTGNFIGVTSRQILDTGYVYAPYIPLTTSFYGIIQPV